MQKFKHYSFDLWMTLIASDSRFKVTRATYIYSKLNPNAVSYQNVERIIRDVDIMCNQCNETTGRNIDAFEMYFMVLNALGHKDITLDIIRDLYNETERMFLIFPPHPFDEDTLDVLNELQARGCSMSITSNTGFIQGRTLRKFIDQSEFYGLFKSMTFSDEVGVSKPNPAIFAEMMVNSDIDIKEIIHVGDNDNADGRGAINAGFHSYIINSNSNRIIDLL